MDRASVILGAFFKRKQQLSKSYSLRAFARDIRVSPSFLSEVMKGKKRLAFDRIDLVAKVLDIDEPSMVELRRAYVPDNVQAAMKSLPAIQTSKDDRSVYVPRSSFNVLKHWYYVAILELTTCSNFDGTVDQIARRLNLHPESVGVAVRELLRHGLLIEESGKLKKIHRDTHFTSATPRQDLAGFFSQFLDRAKAELRDKLNERDRSRRLITGITCSANPEKIELAKNMLAQCLDQIADLLEEGEETSQLVYLGAQLLPLTQED